WSDARRRKGLDLNFHPAFSIPGRLAMIVEYGLSVGTEPVSHLAHVTVPDMCSVTARTYIHPKITLTLSLLLSLS
uniref:hypothetical protein n=1 Tax=Salmonella sp. s59108 TaxID=3159714 RepID=UPI00397EDD61